MLHRLQYRLLLATVVLCISAATVNAVRRSNDTETEFELETRIVGGTQADAGEYPYFVQTRSGGCGGILIASEYVLTAVHCGSLVGQDVLVGAYEMRETTAGAKYRKCVSWKKDPDFEYTSGTEDNPGAPFTNDIALCKLDKPVYVDDSRVTFRLNSQKSYPSAGSSVVALGFGTLEAGGIQPDFIQHVTVRTNSNEFCASAPSGIYNEDTINPAVLCASVNGGGKDACQGDSGGPLVRRTTMNGKRVDYHIGATSWGIGCASSKFPGVYSRTAYSYDWIEKTICDNGKNKSPFCQKPSSCENNERKLVIRVVPDNHPEDISWKLFKNGSEVRSRNKFSSPYMTYEDTICLDDKASYNFIIYDEYGDGLNTGDKGLYSLTVNDVMVKKGYYYGLKDSTQIQSSTILPTSPPTAGPTRGPTVKPTTKRPTKRPTPIPTTKRPTRAPGSVRRAPCDNVPDYTFKNVSQNTCKNLLKNKSQGEKKTICARIDTANNNKTIKYFCPSFCKRSCSKRDRNIQNRMRNNLNIDTNAAK